MSAINATCIKGFMITCIVPIQAHWNKVAEGEAIVGNAWGI